MEVQLLELENTNYYERKKTKNKQKEAGNRREFVSYTLAPIDNNHNNDLHGVAYPNNCTIFQLFF